MNYEFHVGDYVETLDGWIGYVDYWKIYWREVCHEHALILKGIVKKDGKEVTMTFDFVCSNIPRHFSRIGKYTFGYFTKQEKKKIEKLTKPQWGVQVEDLISKINELVDTVNKFRSDYDEHIEAHRQTDR
jgi:hypothetical protein